MRSIDFPRENLRDTSPTALRKYPKALAAAKRDGRKLVDEVGKGRTVEPRDGRKLVEEHIGRSQSIAKRDSRELGPDGPYDATSKVEARRVFKAAEKELKKELLHTALTPEDREVLRAHRASRKEAVVAEPQKQEVKKEKAVQKPKKKKWYKPF